MVLYSSACISERRIANDIQEIIGIHHFFARVGGDEFILLYNHLEDKKALYDMIERIQHLFTEPITIEDYPCDIGISFGISLFPEDGDTVQVLMHDADQKMYNNKHGKRR
ncbi:MAG: GGDEF domain-containing protein [Clostridia bacterium]|nr:GGDEF domain-containing protein [Clostridia bacterium]